MKEEEMLAVVAALTNCPTAPFREEAVRREIEAELRACAGVKVERDSFGNLIATYRRGTRTRTGWAFAAHMDHPGWVRTSDGEMQFLGSVPERYRKRPKRKSFGEFAMWDLAPFELRNGQIHSRACDDLLGCAEIICVLREMAERKMPGHCIGLFTRAEEVGFVGAIQLAKSGRLSRSLTILSLETSTPRGSAEMGKGPIVRVGDRLSIFDGPATARLLAAAEREGIPVQRCLLDGGACEATAYQLYGYTCAAASLALGNYHNVTPEGGIDPEFVAASDFFGMVRLCLAAVTAEEGKDPTTMLRRKLEKNAESFRQFYRGPRA